MKPRIVLQSEDVVTVCTDHVKCDVFLDQSRMPISDMQLINLVKKYHDLTRKKLR